MSPTPILRTVPAVLLIMLLASASRGQTVQVSIPDTTAKKGDTLLIPIRVPSLTESDGVFSGEFNLKFDTGVIDIFDIQTAGTISASIGSILYNNTTRTLAFASTTEITGSGTFVNLKTRVLTSPTRDTTTIWFPDTAFNEGSPKIALDPGLFRILKITVSPKSPPSTVFVGDSLQFSVSGDQVLPLTWTSSDTTVGTVNATGKFKAVGSGQVKIHVEDSQGLKDSTSLFGVFPVQARDLTVSLHDTSYTQTLHFNLPIYISDVSDLNILSGEFVLNFSSTRLQAVDVVTTGSMSAGWFPAFSISSGRIDVALAGSQPLSGSGILVYVRLRVLATASGESTMSLSDVLFNENLNANTVNAQFTPLTAPTVVVSPGTALLARGDTLQFTVTSGGTPPYQWSTAHPTIASIHPSTGLLTALARGTTTVNVVDSFGFVGTSGSIVVNDVEVSLPDTAVWPLDSIDVPIYVDDVTGLGIQSYEIRVTYDSTVVRFSTVISSGTLSEGLTLASNDLQDTVRIAAGGIDLAGSGMLLKLRFKPAPFASAPATSPLNFTRVQFNEPGSNTPTAKTTNGSLSVVDPADVPILASPADGASGVPVDLTLTWNASNGATSYGVQVSTDLNFSTTVVNQSGVTTTSFDLSGLSSVTTYYWRVNAANSGGTSAYSSVFDFTTILAAPGAPVLVSPADEATGVPTNPTLRWNQSATAASYRVQLSLTSDFSTTVLDSSLADTSVALTGLSNNTIHYWRVNAANAGGTGPYSTVFDFTTIIAAPLAPMLLTPADGATGVATNPSLRWNQSATATSYRVQLSLMSDFSTTVLDSTLADTSVAVTGLANSTVYYWRVNASNAGGTSPYSSIFDFTTIIATPSAPMLLTPADGATDVATNPTFKWNQSAGASGYYFQLSTVPDFSTIVLDSSPPDTSHIVSGLSNSTTYFWRVNATNAGGTSAFSAVFQFTTIVASPAAPALVVPADAATDVATNPTFRWNQSSGASSYRFQLSTNSDFSTTVLDSSAHPDTSLAVFNLANNTTYFWRVNASNAGGTSAYSPAYTLTTVLASPVLFFPGDNAVDIPVAVTLRWYSSDGAASYNLQLSLDPSFATTALDSSGIADTLLALSNLIGDTQYYWRVSASNSGGTSVFSPTWAFKTASLTSAVLQLSGVPKEYGLAQNYPNPFNPSTLIRFGIPVQSHVRLTMFDVLGNEVGSVYSGVRQAGMHQVTFSGANLSSGVYFYRLEAIPIGSDEKQPFIHTMKMVLVK